MGAGSRAVASSALDADPPPSPLRGHSLLWAGKRDVGCKKARSERWLSVVLKYDSISDFPMRSSSLRPAHVFAVRAHTCFSVAHIRVLFKAQVTGGECFCENFDVICDAGQDFRRYLHPLAGGGSSLHFFCICFLS